MRYILAAILTSLFLFSSAYAGDFADSAAGIESQLGTIQQDLNTLKDRVDQLPTNLDDIQASLNQLSTNVEAIQTQMDVLLANDSEIRQDITNLNTGLGNVAQNISDLQAEVDEHLTNHPTGEDGGGTVLPIQPLVLSPTDDSYVRGGIHGDNNYGTSANLIVKSQTIGDFIRYTYLKFDLSGIRRPVDSTLLRVYAHSIQQDMTIALHDIEDKFNWTEETITWNNKPSLGEQIFISAPLTNHNYIIWDITNYINARPTQMQFTFVLIAGGEAQSSRNDFYSKESLINQPEISFVWQEQGAMIDAGNCDKYIGDRVEDIHRGNTGTVTNKKCMTLAMIGQWHSYGGGGDNSGYQTIDLTKLPKSGLTLPFARPLGMYKVKWDDGSNGGNNGYNLCHEGLCAETCNYRSYDDGNPYKWSMRCRGNNRFIWRPLPQIFRVADMRTGVIEEPPPPDPEPNCPVASNIIPGKVQAEDYVAYHDTSPGNIGGAYRDDDVDIKETPTSIQIGWVKDGEWLEYPICNIRPGIYTVHFRVSCGITQCGDISLFMDGERKVTVSVPGTGSWDDIHDIITHPRNSFVVLGPDIKTMRIEFSGGLPLDLDWVEFRFDREHSNWPENS